MRARHGAQLLDAYARRDSRVHSGADTQRPGCDAARNGKDTRAAPRGGAAFAYRVGLHARDNRTYNSTACNATDDYLLPNIRGG